MSPSDSKDSKTIDMELTGLVGDFIGGVIGTFSLSYLYYYVFRH